MLYPREVRDAHPHGPEGLGDLDMLGDLEAGPEDDLPVVGRGGEGVLLVDSLSCPADGPRWAAPPSPPA